MSNNYYRPGGFGGFSLFPPVIKNLLIINGIVFLIEMLGQNLLVGGVDLFNLIINWFGLMPLGHGIHGLAINYISISAWRIYTYFI